MFLAILLLLRMTGAGEATVEYEYDSAGHVTEVRYSNGKTVRYGYDGQGNRISKSVESAQ